MPPRQGHNAIAGGSGRGGEAYFAGGGSGFYGAGGVDSYFNQPVLARQPPSAATVFV
jgi:hypothetical protein